MWPSFLPTCWVCCDESEIIIGDGKDPKKANLRAQVSRPKVSLFLPKIAPVLHFDSVQETEDNQLSTTLGSPYRDSRLSDCADEDFEWLRPITDLLDISPADLSLRVDVMANIWQLGREGCCGGVGTYSAAKQPPFGKKLVDCYPSAEVFESRMQDAGIGLACRKGLEHGEMNQDNFIIFITTDESGREWTIAGVFDGHGQDGHLVSLYGARMFLWCALKLIERTQGDLDAVAHHLHGVFGLIHASIALKAKRNFNADVSGSTANLILLHGAEVVCASVGDSRCVVGEKREGVTVGVDLSTDHKPDHKDEEERISYFGGIVIRQAEGLPARVFAKQNPRVGLAMSRSISDLSLHEFGVTWEPSITRRTLDDAFCITLCSDGIWEFMTSQSVIDGFSYVAAESLQLACDSLCEEAQGRWVAEEGNLVDDTTAMCILLERRYATGGRRVQ